MKEYMQSVQFNVLGLIFFITMAVSCSKEQTCTCTPIVSAKPISETKTGISKKEAKKWCSDIDKKWAGVATCKLD